ncbi:MAG TPA: glycosyltransferase [Vicinamibacteria bacterium]|nr:glycosyltransferase [Vicinamibacteria bacterium]
MPLRDEEASVASLLEGITLQTRPPDELVVVDAGSTDATAALVSACEAPIPLRLVRAGPLHPGLARNAGVEAAAHPWLAFTDGGARAVPAWLHDLLAAAEADQADVVFGSFEPVCDSLFRRCAAVAYVPGPGPQGIRGPSVASMALRRDVFDRTGGFPPFRAAEDLIFLERLAALPVRIAYAPGAVVHWELAPDARRTFRRFALYSEHNLRAGRGRYWHRGVLRHYVLMALAGSAALLAGAGAWALAVYPLWQLARAARSAWLKRRAFAFSTLDPRLVVGAAALLCLIDLATFTGALRWLRRPRG